MFSKANCPLNQPRLSFFMKMLYISGVWSYIVAAVSTPTFIMIPIITIWFGVFPIVVSFWAALGLTVYYSATQRYPPPPPSPPPPSGTRPDHITTPCVQQLDATHTWRCREEHRRAARCNRRKVPSWCFENT